MDKKYRLKDIEKYRAKDRLYLSLNKERINLQRRNRRHSNPILSMLSLAKNRAKKRNLSFSLKKEEISIPEFCPILGIPLFVNEDKISDNSPTIDRIDNNIGYIKENVIVISWRANRLKSDASPIELKKISDFYNKEDYEPRNFIQ